MEIKFSLGFLKTLMLWQRLFLLQNRFLSSVSSKPFYEYSPIKSQKWKKKLPFIDTSTEPTVEAAVNNILYNNPSAATSAINRHILNCLVANEPVIEKSVYARVSCLAFQGFWQEEDLILNHWWLQEQK